MEYFPEQLTSHLRGLRVRASKPFDWVVTFGTGQTLSVTFKYRLPAAVQANTRAEGASGTHTDHTPNAELVASTTTVPVRQHPNTEGRKRHNYKRSQRWKEKRKLRKQSQGTADAVPANPEPVPAASSPVQPAAEVVTEESPPSSPGLLGTPPHRPDTPPGTGVPNIAQPGKRQLSPEERPHSGQPTPSEAVASRSPPAGTPAKTKRTKSPEADVFQRIFGQPPSGRTERRRPPPARSVTSESGGNTCERQQNSSHDDARGAVSLSRSPGWQVGLSVPY